MPNQTHDCRKAQDRTKNEVESFVETFMFESLFK